VDVKEWASVAPMSRRGSRRRWNERTGNQELRLKLDSD
jgi:hypothetical protein